MRSMLTIMKNALDRGVIILAGFGMQKSIALWPSVRTIVARLNNT